MKKRNFTSQGFTMIETLIAVAILMISIAGPLTIAQKGLTAAVYARDQVTASFLAQDAMEYIKNIRDFNVKTGVVGGGAGTGWITGFVNCTNSTPTSPCIVNTINGTITTASSEAEYVLYRDGLGYLPTGTLPSQFFRRFYIVPIAGTADEVKAVVTVAWRNGTIENVVTLENQLFNVKR